MGILDELYIRKKIRKILQEKSKKVGEAPPESAISSPAKIEVTVGDLSARDGVYYMVHTLNGGINAGSLDLGHWNADIDKGGPGVVITLTSTKKKGKVKRGKVGGGRVKQSVKEAGALATEKPQELMKRLGNPKTSGDTLPEKVLNFIRTSIYGNKTMVKAYTGARIKASSEKED